MSDEYILEVGANLGANGRLSFVDANNALRAAQRAVGNAKSGQEKSAAQRQLKDAQSKYEKERAKLIEDINRKYLNSNKG